MNKLINFFKNNKKVIIGFIIGVIFTGSIGVFAYTINAKDVAFTPRNKNWNVSNVEEAIDYLKENTGINLNNIDVEYISSYGQQYTSRELNKQLEKGEYLIYTTTSWQWAVCTSNYINDSFEGPFGCGGGGCGVSISCNSGDCNIKRVKNYFQQISAPGKCNTLYNIPEVFDIKVTSENANLRYLVNTDGNDTTNPWLLFAYIIKVK